MTEHVQVGGLQVAKVLFDFVNNEAIPGTSTCHRWRLGGTYQGLLALLTGLSGMRLRLKRTSVQRYVVRAAAYYMINCGCEN